MSVYQERITFNTYRERAPAMRKELERYKHVLRPHQLTAYEEPLTRGEGALTRGRTR